VDAIILCVDHCNRLIWLAPALHGPDDRAISVPSMDQSSQARPAGAQLGMGGDYDNGEGS
jgi:hypothetical protein